MIQGTRHPASFRDPCGFVFRGEDSALYRQVNSRYEKHYRRLTESGLYEALLKSGEIVEHEEVALESVSDPNAFRVLRLNELPFISYPYEWSFSGLKTAALLTLDIQLKALDFEMTLKDASAYNIQFTGVKPIFIDTLSFENYVPGRPWQAYGQFCRHFLAPLALMAKKDIDLGKLLTLYLDGLDLSLASRLLPWKTRLSPGLVMHLHLHARMTQRYSDTSQKRQDTSQAQLSLESLRNIVRSLRNLISRLNWNPVGTTWADYYSNNSYDSDAFETKKNVIEGYLQRIQPRTVWDLGANTGVFSRIATKLGARACAFDIDPACVEANFRQCVAEKTQKLLPLRMDLTNPSPALGWGHHERDSLCDRGPVDCVMSLALMHHLAIANNVPFEMLASLMAKLGKFLIIEFIPKDDPQTQRLLSGREDIFEDYHRAAFTEIFSRHFDIEHSTPVGRDGRILYLMKSKR